MRHSMVRLSLSLLVALIGLGLLWGCSSTQDRVEKADESIRDAQPETKVGVIDMVEVLKRTKIGQPAFANLERDVEALSRPEPPEPWYLYKRYRVYYPRPPKRWNGYKSFGTAVGSILPKVETVVQDLAEQNGFEAVLQKGTSDAIMIALYDSDMIDLTNEVIEELNRRFP